MIPIRNRRQKTLLIDGQLLKSGQEISASSLSDNVVTAIDEKSILTGGENLTNYPYRVTNLKDHPIHIDGRRVGAGEVLSVTKISEDTSNQQKTDTISIYPNPVTTDNISTNLFALRAYGFSRKRILGET